MDHNIEKSVADWLESCRRNKKISRNTIAVGLVILDRLRHEPVIEKTTIVSRGGEITGSRAGLPKLLAKFGLPENFLKEATTRQAHQDGQRLLNAVQYGKAFSSLNSQKRDLALRKAIDSLVGEARAWLNRQNIKISCDRHESPVNWIAAILAEAKGKSGGAVEQHLVGAKLERRLPEIKIPNHPSHAGDVQTGRSGDFTIGTTCFHVTGSPTSKVIVKCAENASAGLHPVLLVPLAGVAKSRNLAEDAGVSERITILAIEDFIASNIIEMSKGKQQEFYTTLEGIIISYNRRLLEVETDPSLRIEVK